MLIFNVTFFSICTFQNMNNFLISFYDKNTGVKFGRKATKVLQCKSLHLPKHLSKNLRNFT